ncbi:MAG: hypothetical protein SFW35_09445 [Chitinophagales bacterium]|nr:hypothetical protein [Chitinophagales bacterium]
MDTSGHVLLSDFAIRQRTGAWKVDLAIETWHLLANILPALIAKIKLCFVYGVDLFSGTGHYAQGVPAMPKAQFHEWQIILLTETRCCFFNDLKGLLL